MAVVQHLLYSERTVWLTLANQNTLIDARHLKYPPWPARLPTHTHTLQLVFFFFFYHALHLG